MAHEGSGRGCTKHYSQDPASGADGAEYIGQDRRRRSPEGEANWALHTPSGGVQEAMRDLSLIFWKEIKVRGRDLGIVSTSGKALGEDGSAPEESRK